MGETLNCELTWDDGEPYGALIARENSSREVHYVGIVLLSDEYLRHLAGRVDTIITANGCRRVEFTVPAPAPTVLAAGLTGGLR